MRFNKNPPVNKSDIPSLIRHLKKLKTSDKEAVLKEIDKIKKKEK